MALRYQRSVDTLAHAYPRRARNALLSRAPTATGSTVVGYSDTAQADWSAVQMQNEPAEPESGREDEVAGSAAMRMPAPSASVPDANRGSWLDQAQKVTAVLALGGVLIFGALLLAYGQFYRELGVSLNDVGVEYGKALGGAAGLTIVLLISTTVVAAGVWFAADRVGRHVSFVPTMFCTFALLTLVAAVSLARWANQRASAVKQGKPVESVRLLGFEILSIRAAPAVVQVAQSEQTSRLSKSVEALKQPLFYLGQGRGQVVLYEQPTQHAIFIPSSLLALLQTSNCETHRSPDKICRDVKK